MVTKFTKSQSDTATTAIVLDARVMTLTFPLDDDIPDRKVVARIVKPKAA